MPYVSVEHQPGVWVDAHIEKQWKHADRWQLSCYYFVEGSQYYRVFEANQVRPAGSRAERHDDGERYAVEQDSTMTGRYDGDGPAHLAD